VTELISRLIGETAFGEIVLLEMRFRQNGIRQMIRLISKWAPEWNHSRAYLEI